MALKGVVVVGDSSSLPWGEGRVGGGRESEMREREREKAVTK